MTGGHPKGLQVLFYTEMWERFSYYGMRAILVLYMTKALGFDVAHASTVYGNFTGLAYLMPLAGGYIADRWWGNRRSTSSSNTLTLRSSISRTRSHLLIRSTTARPRSSMSSASAAS